MLPSLPKIILNSDSITIDCLVYTRGSKENIDEWAKLSGDEGWGWDKLLPYFKKVRHINDVTLNLRHLIFLKLKLIGLTEREIQFPR